MTRELHFQQAAEKLYARTESANFGERRLVAHSCPTQQEVANIKNLAWLTKPKAATRRSTPKE